MYSALRAMTGESRRRPKTEGRRPRDQQKVQEVSLADVAIMKDKKEKDEDSSMDESVLN